MILIVDDVPENVYSLQKVLESRGFAVDTAFSGEEALRKILSHQYILILLDVQMPGIDGFEVAENIRGFKKAKDTAVVFVSANYTDINMIIKGYNHGAVDYITKPVDPDLLLLKVKTIYKLYESKQENCRENKEIQVLYEHAKEYNQKLSTKIDRFKEVLELAGIAEFEYFPNDNRLISSAQLNKIFKGDEDVAIDKEELFAKLGLSGLEVLQPSAGKKSYNLNCQLEMKKEVKDLKVLLQVESENGLINRILGVIQEVKNELV